MKTAYDIIIKPVITEQSMEATEDKKYVFQVARKSTPSVWKARKSARAPLPQAVAPAGRRPWSS